MKKIGSIIGYDKLIGCYLNRNIDELVNELSKYLSEEESIEVIKTMDDMVFSGYAKTFISKNSKMDSFEKMSFKEYQLKKSENKNKLNGLLQKGKINALKDENFMSFEKLVNDYLFLSISDDEDFKKIYR